MGKVRISQVLARAGLHLGASTVGRMRKEGEPLSPCVTDLAAIEVTTRVVTAKYPDHVWHVELSTVPTSAGFWVPWLPYARPQSWPFCWWVAVVVDHFSRAVVGFAVSVKRPTSLEMQRVLDRAIRKVGSPAQVRDLRQGNAVLV